MEFCSYSPPTENTLISSMEMRLRSGSNLLQSKIRILVMGSKGVGKASFVEYFVNKNCIKEYRHRDYYYPDMVTKSNFITEFTVVNETFNPSLRNMSIKQAHAFVLLYSVDDEESFEYVSELKDQLRETKGDNVPLIIIGNKNDVTDKEVHPVVTDCVVTIDWELPHVVGSVQTGDHMGDVYKTMLDMLCKHDFVKYESNQEMSRPRFTSRRLSVPTMNLARMGSFRERSSSGSKSKWVLVKTLFEGNKM